MAHGGRAEKGDREFGERAGIDFGIGSTCNRFEIEIVLLQWTHQESATSQRTIPRDCLCDLAHRHWPARSERFKWQDMHTFIQL